MGNKQSRPSSEHNEIPQEVGQDSITSTRTGIVVPHETGLTAPLQSYVKPFTSSDSGPQQLVEQQLSKELAVITQPQPAAPNYDTEAKTATENYQYCVIDIENSGEGAIVYLKDVRYSQDFDEITSETYDTFPIPTDIISEPPSPNYI